MCIAFLKSFNHKQLEFFLNNCNCFYRTIRIIWKAIFITFRTIRELYDASRIIENRPPSHFNLLKYKFFWKNNCLKKLQNFYMSKTVQKLCNVKQN